MFESQIQRDSNIPMIQVPQGFNHRWWFRNSLLEQTSMQQSVFLMMQIKVVVKVECPQERLWLSCLLFCFLLLFFKGLCVYVLSPLLCVFSKRWRRVLILVICSLSPKKWIAWKSSFLIFNLKSKLSNSIFTTCKVKISSLFVRPI